ncbi:MAG: sulfite exporter TauE/SafE family protein [Deltaproteobacteria bacterium]|nr:sulfite exporter TauE/SafE family protein [Deltaproteobacteria bacterium]
MSLQAHVMIALSLFFGAFVHGSVGFGSALIAVSLTSLILGIKTAVPFVAPYALLIAAFLLWHALDHVEWCHFAYPAVGTLFGVPAGIWLLKSLSPPVMKNILGVFMLAFVIWSILWRRVRFVIIRARIWGFVSGFMGGVFGGAIAVPGPPLVMFVSLSTWSKETMRSVIQAYLIFTYVLTLVIFGGTGMVNRETLLLNLYHLPGVVLGMLAGQALFQRIPQRWFIRGVLAMLTVLGVRLCW